MKKERNGSWRGEEPFTPDLTVYSKEKPEESGLLDRRGNKMIRPLRKIGFGYRYE